MALPSTPSPSEFGAALRELRTAAGVELERIGEQTKISRRVLEAIEAGEFARLPDRIFVRLFVRQYLGMVGAQAEPWLRAFDAAWDKYLRGSQQLPLFPPSAVRPRPRLGPWVLGVLLVASTLAALLWLQHRNGGDAPTPELPTPTEVAAAIAPTPEPPATPETATPTPPPEAEVVFTTLDGQCWIEVRPDGGTPLARLLPAHSRWELDLGGHPAEVKLGNAGVVEIRYRGEALPPSGRAGQVARVRLGSAGPA